MKWNKKIKFLIFALVIATFLLERNAGISVAVKFKNYENEKYSSFVTAKEKDGYVNDDLSMFMNDDGDGADEVFMDLPPIDKDKTASKEKKSEIEKLNIVNKNTAVANKLNKQSHSKEDNIKKEQNINAKPAHLEDKSKLKTEIKIPNINQISTNASKEPGNNVFKKSTESSPTEPVKSKFIPKMKFSSVINKIKFKSRKSNLEDPKKENKDPPIFDAKKEIDRIKNENINNKDKPKEIDQLKSKEVNRTDSIINSAKKDSDNKANIDNKKKDSENKTNIAPNTNDDINKKSSSSISLNKQISELPNNDKSNQSDKNTPIKNDINSSSVQKVTNTNKLPDNKIPIAISNTTPLKESSNNASINHSLNIDANKNDKPKVFNNVSRKKSPFLNFLQTKNSQNDLTGEDSETVSSNTDKNNQNININKIENTLENLTEAQGKPINSRENSNSNMAGGEMKSSSNTNTNGINNLSSTPNFSSQNLNDNNNNNNNINSNPFYKSSSENLQLFSQLDSGFVQNLIKIQNDPDIQNILAKKKDSSFNTNNNNYQYMMNNQRNSNQDSLRQREKINRNLYKNYYKPDAIDLSKLNYINNLIGNIRNEIQKKTIENDQLSETSIQLDKSYEQLNGQLMILQTKFDSVLNEISETNGLKNSQSVQTEKLKESNKILSETKEFFNKISDDIYSKSDSIERYEKKVQKDLKDFNLEKQNLEKNFSSRAQTAEEFKKSYLNTEKSKYQILEKVKNYFEEFSKEEINFLKLKSEENELEIKLKNEENEEKLIAMENEHLKSTNMIEIQKIEELKGEIDKSKNLRDYLNKEIEELEEKLKNADNDNKQNQIEYELKKNELEEKLTELKNEMKNEELLNNEEKQKYSQIETDIKNKISYITLQNFNVLDPDQEMRNDNISNLSKRSPQVNSLSKPFSFKEDPDQNRQIDRAYNNQNAPEKNIDENSLKNQILMLLKKIND